MVWKRGSQVTLIVRCALALIMVVSADAIAGPTVKFGTGNTQCTLHAVAYSEDVAARTFGLKLRLKVHDAP